MIDIPSDADDETVSELCLRHYIDKLKPEDRAKDTEPMNTMLKLIKEFEGLRIYRLK